jgi:hypothetical protein
MFHCKWCGCHTHSGVLNNTERTISKNYLKKTNDRNSKKS